MIGPLLPQPILQPFFQPLQPNMASDLAPETARSDSSRPLSTFSQPDFRLPGSLPPLLRRQWTSPAGYPLILYTLPNGHRLIVEQRPSDFIGLRTFINGGSVIENAIAPSPLYRNVGLPSGIAHLDEHCHFLASQNYPVKNSWHATVDGLAGRTNASTSDEMIQHELFFNREDADTMLRLHAESVLRPIYNAQDLGQEKANVLNEIAMRGRKPINQLLYNMMGLLYDRPGNQTCGKPEDILATTPQHLALLNQLLYAPTNMVTMVSGNVNPEQVLGVLGPEFGKNPARLPHTGNQALRLALKPGEVRSAHITDSQLSNSKVGISFPAPPKGNYPDRMALEFLREILDGDDTAILQTQLVSGSGLSSGLDSFYMPLKQSGSYNVVMDVTPGQEQAALGGALNAIALVSQGLISDQVVANIRERLVRRFQSKQDSIPEVTHDMGAEAVTNTLPYFLNYERIANLITAEDLQRVAEQYLNPRTYAVVFATPAQPVSASQPGGSVAV